MGRIMYMRKGDAHSAPIKCIEGSTLAAGSSVWLNVNGTLTEFLVVNQGIPSDSSLYDSSCDGIWLLMKDLYVTKAWDSSNNDYANSDIHTYLNGTFLNLLDTDIQTLIKTVKIPYYTSGTGSLKSGSNGLSAQVFLLSFTEVGYAYTAAPVVGVTLDYFTGISDSGRIAYLNGEAVIWWTRTPYLNYTEYAWKIDEDGSAYYAADVSSQYGIRPALILPADTLFKDNGDGKMVVAV